MPSSYGLSRIYFYEYFTIVFAFAWSGFILIVNLSFQGEHRMYGSCTNMQCDPSRLCSRKWMEVAGVYGLPLAVKISAYIDVSHASRGSFDF